MGVSKMESVSNMDATASQTNTVYQVILKLRSLLKNKAQYFNENCAKLEVTKQSDTETGKSLH